MTHDSLRAKMQIGMAEVMMQEIIMQQRGR
jgi:hypothetical protein